MTTARGPETESLTWHMIDVGADETITMDLRYAFHLRPMFGYVTDH